MELIQEMGPKGMQVTWGMSQKFEFEIHQNLVCGAVDQDWRSKFVHQSAPANHLTGPCWPS